MKASERRENIIRVLNHSTEPVSARKLAEKFQVSRQVIVGDIALLRAEGKEILATPQGYLAAKPAAPSTSYIKQIVCLHDDMQTKDELYTIVDLGGQLIDVVVEHPVYGELRGKLNISTREDADRFIENMSKYQTEFLSVLTRGIHSHTLSTPDLETFERIIRALDEKNILYKND